MTDADVLMECEGLEKYFPVEQALVSRLLGNSPEYVKAVDGVDLSIERGEIVGLAGESGCGKTTLGKTLIRLLEPTAGTIQYDGENVTNIQGSELKRFRRNVQIIFQDPFESLNPRRTIYATVAEPLLIHGIGDSRERDARVVEALERAELRPAEQYLDQYPHQLSGGEKQRVAIARALVLEPDFLLADEPVSMLDVSIRAGILNLLERLNEELGITMLFISHDLSLLRHVCERIGIMYLGRVVELGETEAVIQDPTHPYAEALISSAPEPDPLRDRTLTEIRGSIPDPVNLPDGCRFKDRCPIAEPVCGRLDPKLGPASDNPNKRVACHPKYTEKVRKQYEQAFERRVTDSALGQHEN